MVPTPKKPIPEITWADIRTGSVTSPMVFHTNNPIKAVMQAPTHTNIWVRNPAGRLLFSLSMPINPPSNIAKRIRATTEISLNCPNCFHMLYQSIHYLLLKISSVCAPAPIKSCLSQVDIWYCTKYSNSFSDN